MAQNKGIQILFGQSRPSLTWMIVSSIGGFLGIFLIDQTGRLVGVETKASLFLIGSFGASAVLVYGVPQASFSQPGKYLS